MTALVWAWVAINTVGLAVGLWNSRDAYKDIKALRMQGVHNGRHVIALALLRSQLVRTLQAFLLWAIGVASLVGWPGQPLRRAVNIYTLMAVAILIASSSVSDALVKRRLLARREQEGHDS